MLLLGLQGLQGLQSLLGLLGLLGSRLLRHGGHLLRSDPGLLLRRGRLLCCTGLALMVGNQQLRRRIGLLLHVAGLQGIG